MKKQSIPHFYEKGSMLILQNDYWQVSHDIKKGGCISSVVFFNGSRKNFLCQPIFAHATVAEKHKIVVYKQNLAMDCKWKIEEKQPYVEIVVEGHFYNSNGEPLCLKFQQRYRYYPWGLVKIKLAFFMERELRDVYELGACNFYVSGRADTIGLRPSSSGWDYPASMFCRWMDVEGTGRSYKSFGGPVGEHYIPIHFCIMEKGVEGIEFYRGSDHSAWNSPFRAEPGQASFSYYRESSNRYFNVSCKVFCNGLTTGTFKRGRYELEYYLGLPFIKKAEKMTNTVFQANINSQWPLDKHIKKMADNNIKLLLLADDNTWKPKNWPDGLYPPYAPEDMKEMDRVIDTAHKYGMKIVPYFSLKEFHPSCPAFKKNADSWKRWVDTQGTIQGIKGPYGGYMCMKSGWLGYRKKSIDEVLKKHKFDGVYYDHMWHQACRHPKHCNGHPHTDIDEVLDFLFWTRQRIGEEGFMFVHLSGCPSMVAENMADLVFVSEDFAECRSLPGNFDPLCEFVPITPRHSVPSKAHNSSNPAYYRIQHMACILEGWPASFSLSQESSQLFLLNEFRKFGKYDLRAFSFLPARKEPVKTGEKNVYAALYYNTDKCLVYCANFGKRKKSVKLKSSLTCWPFCINTEIAGYSSRLLELRK